MTFNRILGNEAELSDEERDHIAERIDQTLDEWGTDFESENVHRRELKACIQVLLDGEDTVGQAKTPLAKCRGMRSEIMNNRPVDDSDDTIFNLEAQIEERGQRIRVCRVISGRGGVSAEQEDAEIGGGDGGTTEERVR